jgi:uncharacterized protein YcfJ
MSKAPRSIPAKTAQPPRCHEACEPLRTRSSVEHVCTRVLARAVTRRLGRNDVIYRGSDNRYYCRRDDGTTGLIVGGITGGVLGNIITPGGSKTLGTILGAGAGALVGRAIDDGNVVCR